MSDITFSYIIEQLTSLNNWEPIPDSESATVDEAIASMELLQSELGWTDMRVREQYEYNGQIERRNVICYSND